MTRQEFIDDVTTWDDLVAFCSEEDYDLEDIYSAEQRDDYINEDLVEMARYNGWRDLLETLNDLSNGDGYDYYRRDYNGDWVVLEDNDEEFNDLKGYVIEWMDENNYWPDDEEDGDEEEYNNEEEPPPAEEDEFDDDDDDDVDDDIDIEKEDCSVHEMFAASVHCIRAIAQEEIDSAKERDMAFVSLVTKA